VLLSLSQFQTLHNKRSAVHAEPAVAATIAAHKVSVVNNRTDCQPVGWSVNRVVVLKNTSLVGVGLAAVAGQPRQKG
jgi:hypothetical protein